MLNVVDWGNGHVIEVAGINGAQGDIVCCHAVRADFCVRQKPLLYDIPIRVFPRDCSGFFQVSTKKILKPKVNHVSVSDAVFSSVFTDERPHGVGQRYDGLLPALDGVNSPVGCGVCLHDEQRLADKVVHGRGEVGGRHRVFIGGLVAAHDVASPGFFFRELFDGRLLLAVELQHGAHYGCRIFGVLRISLGHHNVYGCAFKAALAADVLTRLGKHRGDYLLHRYPAFGNGVRQLLNVVHGMAHICLEVQAHNVRALCIRRGRIERAMRRLSEHRPNKFRRILYSFFFLPCVCPATACIVALVKDKHRAIGDASYKLTPNGVLALYAAKLRVGCEHCVVSIEPIFYRGIQPGFMLFARLCCQRASVWERNRGRARQAAIRYERLEPTHPYVRDVADHVGIQVWLHGHKDRNQAIFSCVPDDCRIDAALSDACLVANDEACATINVVDGKGNGVYLLSGEAGIQVRDRKPQLCGNIFVDVAASRLKIVERAGYGLRHVFRDKRAHGVARTLWGIRLLELRFFLP